MCCESCFECQEPCWQVDVKVGNDLEKVSLADTVFFNKNTTYPLNKNGIRNSNDRLNPVAAKPPEVAAGNSCHSELEV